jgi:hypothetical protein
LETAYYSPVLTNLLHLVIDKLAAGEPVALIAGASVIPIATVYASTTKGSVLAVIVRNVDEVIAFIPVHSVRIPKPPWGVTYVVPRATHV